MKLLSKRRLAPLALTAVALMGAAVQPSVYAAPTSQKASSDLRTRTQQHIAALFSTAGNKVRDLNLTADQKVKLRAIAQQNAPLARAIWNDNSLTRQQKAIKLGALRDKARAVLTSTQREKLASGQGEAMGQLFQTAAWVSNELKLTSDQQSKIRGIVMTNFAKGRQSGGGNGQFGAIRSLVLDADGQIQKVLTPQQQSKWVVIRSVAREGVMKRAKQFRAMNRA